MDLDSGGNDMFGMLNDALQNPHVDTRIEGDEQTTNDPQIGPNEESAKYYKLLEDAKSELFSRCQKFTSLAFIVRLLNVKVLNTSTDKSLDMTLELLHEAFQGVKLPTSYYEAQKITSDLGFTYETWDACPDNCMLFRNKDAKLDDVSYVTVLDGNSMMVGDTVNENAIQMRYFPLKKRLFMSSKMAKIVFVLYKIKGGVSQKSLGHHGRKDSLTDQSKEHSATFKEVDNCVTCTDEATHSTNFE